MKIFSTLKIFNFEIIFTSEKLSFHQLQHVSVQWPSGTAILAFITMNYDNMTSPTITASPPPTLRSASHLPPWRKRNLGRPKRVLKEVIVLEDGEHVVMADFWSFARWVLLILAESGQISLYSEELHPLAILFLYSGIIVFIPLYWKGKKRKQKIFVSVAKLT